MKQKNIFIIIIVVLAVAVAGYFFLFIQEPIQPDTTAGKIDINAVCEGALAYMTFTDGASADAFVAECKEGKHPEVIDQYIENLGLGDGAAI